MHGVRPIALLVCLPLLSSACIVVSLQPVYDDSSVVFEQALVGNWVNAEEETSVTIERAEWRSYKVVYTDRFATRNFHGNLTKIGDATWLDLTEVRGEEGGPFLLPVHGFYRVSVAGDVLSASPLEYSWMMRAIDQKGPKGLNATVDGRRNVVIASSTADLRKWLAAAPAEAVGVPSAYKRAGGARRAGGAKQ